MALISKIKAAKPSYIIHHFKRHYFQIPANRFINQIASQRTPENYFLSNTPFIRADFQPRDGFFNTSVRFFAAPVQIKKKEEVSNPTRHRINEEIEVDQIRLVTDDGHIILSRREALNRAKDLKLDLVLVDHSSDPPVCKIMDYHREKYKKQVKERERAKLKSAGSLKGGDCKEIRFSAKTELKDLKMKADSVKRLIERGYRVKCSATGSEDQDLMGMLSQLSSFIEDVIFVESGPTMGRDQAYLIVRHVKFGPSKKGGKKSSKDKSAASSGSKNAATASNDSCAVLSEESGKDSDDEVETPLEGQQKSDDVHDMSGKISSRDKQRFDRGATCSTANNNASRLASPTIPKFAGPNATPVVQETENRYARTVAKNTSAARNPMGLRDNGAVPQPQPIVPSPRGPRQSGGEGFLHRNSDHPPDRLSQPRAENQNRSSQPNSNFSASTGQVQPPRSVGNSKPQSPGFGTFSSTKVDVNNPNNANPSNVTRIPGPRKDTGNLNSSTSKSDGPQSSGSADKKFGIFSK